MNVVDYIIHSNNLFWNNNYFYLLLFIFSLVLLMEKDSKRITKDILLFTFILLFAILFNPLLQLLLPTEIKENDAVFARFWILLPAFLLIPIAIVALIEKQSNHIKRIIIAVTIVIIVVSGNSICTMGAMNSADNCFKINDEAVTLANILLKQNEDSPRVILVYVGTSTDGNFMNGGNVPAGIPQYTAQINLKTLYTSNEQWNDYYLADTTPEGVDGGAWLGYILKDFIYERFEYDYIIMPNDDRIDAKMSSEGFALLDSTEHYRIYYYDQGSETD